MSATRALRLGAGGCTLGLALAGLMGCAESAAGVADIDVTESDSAGVVLIWIEGDVDDLPALVLSETPVMEVTGNAPPFLGSIGEVEILSDGSVLVEDNQTDELRRFDATGSETGLLGVAGEGPGEFQNLTELTATVGDTAYAYDRRLYRIARFDPDGTLGATIPVGRERAGRGSLVLDAWPLDSERFLLLSSGAGDDAPRGDAAFRDEREAVLHLVDGDGLELRPALRFPGGYSISGTFGDITAPFGNRPFASVGGRTVAHGSGVTYEIVFRTPGLDVARIVRWRGWRTPLSDALEASVRASMEETYEEFAAIRPDVAAAMFEGVFDPELLPDTLPALSNVFLDDTGRAWVSTFAPTTRSWDETDRWHLLDAHGVPTARLRLPGSSRLVAARGDRIAIVVRDELDVEHLQVFEVRTPDVR